jgi:glyoxylase-like metal-dependent hydrolase (beta-lactamase superfamily II)
MPATDDLYFRQIEMGPMANFVYLIGSRSAREAVVVDPAWSVKQVLDIAAADGMRVTAALVSHFHPDHVGGNFMGQHIEGLVEFLELCKGRIHVHKAEAGALPVPESETSPTDEHSRIEVGGIVIECIHTPGHTPGSQCFRVLDRVVSGDTLFIGSCGRTDLPGSDPGELYESLTQKLMKLEENTLVYPGHNYSEEGTFSSIGKEKAHNPMVRFPSKAAFLAAMGYGR